MLLTGRQANKDENTTLAVWQRQMTMVLVRVISCKLEMVYLDSINFQTMGFNWCRYVQESDISEIYMHVMYALSCDEHRE